MITKERISEFLDKIYGIPDNPCKSSLFNHISQAIDIIEAQAAMIVDLEAALRPFADVADHDKGDAEGKAMKTLTLTLIDQAIDKATGR